jgi:hypothetical protein
MIDSLSGEREPKSARFAAVANRPTPAGQSGSNRTFNDLGQPACQQQNEATMLTFRLGVTPQGI